MTQSTFDKFFMPVFLVFITVFGCVWIGKTIYYIYNPEPNREITFKVVGIVNATNSSIVSIQEGRVCYLPTTICLQANGIHNLNTVE